MNPKQREEWDTMLLAPLPTPKGKKKKAQPVATGDSGFMDAMATLKKGGA
jgi:hypothetical protein